MKDSNKGVIARQYHQLDMASLQVGEGLGGREEPDVEETIWREIR
jgi:hypothetical protein